MANESTPANPLPLDFVPEGAVEKHRVADGEDWASVAKQYAVDVNALIYFNFHTNVPEEVNWYMRRNLGCNVSNDGDVNWAFSSSASPGIIYIPPATVISMDPEDVTVDTRTIMERLQEIAKTIDGDPGIRIRKIMDLAAQVGSPNDEHLWYYNGLAVLHYIQLETTNDERREMTKDTNGQFPFDGDAGADFGPWEIKPFRDILVLDATNHQSDSDLKTWLIWLDGQIETSIHEIMQKHYGGGGTTEGLVDEFMQHIGALAEKPIHLYFFYQDADQ
jgi:hypothetical protein